MEDHRREYGRHLEGEYVRRRLRVKALGMEEASVDAPAGVAGESGVSITNIEGRGGFEPFVDERDDRVGDVRCFADIAGGKRLTQESKLLEYRARRSREQVMKSKLL